MKITKRQLRRIIRESVPHTGIKENKDAPRNVDISSVVDRFSTPFGKKQWFRVEGEFYSMAEGDDLDGVRQQYYPGWSDENFIDVIETVTGEYSP